MLKIAFAGITDSFDFDYVGGASSVIRRIAIALVETGNQIDFVQYGTASDNEFDIRKNFKQRNFMTFDGFLNGLKENYDHIVYIYIKPSERVKFANFRNVCPQHTVFHQIYLHWNESWLKRQLYFVERRLFPFNGRLFCVSPRIYNYVAKWSDKATLLLPSVPESYFLSPSEKSNSSKLRIAYLGRVDPGKGTMEAVEVIEYLRSLPNIQSKICGFSWPRLPDTVNLEKKLLANKNIRYEIIKPDKWTEKIDDNLRNLLRETDILLLPYKKLSSTIDVPLLLLEAMASLCAVISTPLGDIPDLYGHSYFSLSEKWDSEFVIDMIKKSAEHLPAERERLCQQNQKLNFSTSNIANIFRDALVGNI